MMMQVFCIEDGTAGPQSGSDNDCVVDGEMVPLGEFEPQFMGLNIKGPDRADGTDG